MSAPTDSTQSAGEKLILIGTHGFHIHSLLFDPVKKTLRKGKSCKTSENPSWLTAHPTLPDVIYANGHAEGKVFALRLTDKEGGMDLMSEASSGGNGPTHIAVHPQAGVVLAHYNTGNATTVPISSSGDLSSPSATSSFKPQLHRSTYTHHPRQEGPHAHQAIVHEPSGDVFIPDLGSNVVWRLRWDTDKGELREVEGESLTGFELGDGPRHLVFHPDGTYLLLRPSFPVQEPPSPSCRHYYTKKAVFVYGLYSRSARNKMSSADQAGVHVYTITELSSHVVVHSLKSPSKPQSRFPIQPSTDIANSATMLASEIVLLPADSTGSHLLIASNRDSVQPEGDALALFSVSVKDGSDVRPKEEQFVLGGGKHLRGVAGDTAGKWVCVTARNGGGVTIYEHVEGGLKEVARNEEIEHPVSPLWIE